jgi:hypothetical protein
MCWTLARKYISGQGRNGRAASQESEQRPRNRPEASVCGRSSAKSHLKGNRCKTTASENGYRAGRCVSNGLAEEHCMPFILNAPRCELDRIKRFPLMRVEPARRLAFLVPTLATTHRLSGPRTATSGLPTPRPDSNVTTMPAGNAHPVQGRKFGSKHSISFGLYCTWRGNLAAAARLKV